MANICEYKVIVKGKKNACYAFYGSMSVINWKEIKEWIPDKDDETRGTLKFSGDCKWDVDFYCSYYEGEISVNLPEDYKDAEALAEDNFWHNTVQDRSKMFRVEVQCNSEDIDDPFGGYYEHYINGEPCEDNEGKAPEELKIEIDDYDEVE